MVREFKDDHRRAARALQIWQILICKASQRQTVTYGELARMLGFGGAGVMGGMLHPLMCYCAENGLPPLTVLVVNQDTGLPGEGLTSVRTNLHAECERVYQYNWFAIHPPTIEELEQIAHKTPDF